MLFSGFYSERQCASCGYEIARATPTSLIFFLLLVAGGSAVVTPPLARVIGPPWRWWYGVAVGVAELILITAILAVCEWIRGWIRRPLDTCPRCSGTMTLTTSGMYDFGCLPTVLEIVLLVIFVAAHVGVVLWLR